MGVAKSRVYLIPFLVSTYSQKFKSKTFILFTLVLGLVKANGRTCTGADRIGELPVVLVGEVEF
jgi:hypothetical protein